jgi:dienelactone hydrolase
MVLRWSVLASSLALVACATDPKPVGWTAAAEPAELKAPGAQWIKADAAGSRKLLAAVFRPQGRGPFPVVVVLHGASGLQQDHLALAAELARAGFIGVAGCWQFIASPPAAAPNPVCADAPPQAAWQKDPAAHSGKELIAAARTLPGARADRVGLYGLSRGGNAALWAASTGASVQALVVDAPAHLPAARVVPPPPSTQTAVKGLSAPTLMLHGTSDRVVPVEQSREYDKAARALGKPVTTVIYEGMGHMVTFPPAGKEPPELEAARRSVQPQARQRAIEFLRAQLGR